MDLHGDVQIGEKKFSGQVVVKEEPFADGFENEIFNQRKGSNDAPTELVVEIAVKEESGIGDVWGTDHEYKAVQDASVFCLVKEEEGGTNEVVTKNACQLDTGILDAERIADLSEPKREQPNEDIVPICICSTFCGHVGVKCLSQSLPLPETDSEKPHSCKLCGKTFRRGFDLLKHNCLAPGYTSKPYTCTLCGRNFTARFTLYRHTLGHTGEKPSYTCPQCGKSYSDHWYLQTHIAEHAGLLPFQCDLCDKRFSRRQTLQIHVKKHSDEVFSCDKCDKTFKRLYSLKRHAEKHTGLRPYSCELCGKRFRRKEVLLQHRQLHKGDKRFLCGYCGKSFGNARRLIEHTRRYKDDKCLCEFCDRRFCKKKLLRLHMLKHIMKNVRAAVLLGNA